MIFMSEFVESRQKSLYKWPLLLNNNPGDVFYLIIKSFLFSYGIIIKNFIQKDKESDKATRKVYFLIYF